MNSFTSIINKDLENKCPFCTHRETVFHCFAEYQRLSKLFVFYRRRSLFLAKSLLKGFLFFGFKYTKQNFRFQFSFSFWVKPRWLSTWPEKGRLMEGRSSLHFRWVHEWFDAGSILITAIWETIKNYKTWSHLREFGVFRVYCVRYRVMISFMEKCWNYEFSFFIINSFFVYFILFNFSTSFFI